MLPSRLPNPTWETTSFHFTNKRATSQAYCYYWKMCRAYMHQLFVRVRHETTTLLVEYHQGFMNGHFVGESEIIVFSQEQIYSLKLMEA
jgi:hypothetical protein